MSHPYICPATQIFNFPNHVTDFKDTWYWKKTTLLHTFHFCHYKSTTANTLTQSSRQTSSLLDVTLPEQMNKSLLQTANYVKMEWIPNIPQTIKSTESQIKMVRLYVQIQLAPQCQLC